MGASVSARADDLEKNKKLDFSPRTSELLDDLIAFVRNFSVEYPREAKVSFQRGFQWRTRLTEDHLLKQPDGRERFNYSESSITSKEKTDGGEPCILLSKVEDVILNLSLPQYNRAFKANMVHRINIYDIQCWSFESLGYVLKVATEAGFASDEARECVEANPDPMTNILGKGFATMGHGPALLATHERLQRERARSNANQSGEVEQLDDKFRLTLLLNSLDIKLLKSSVQTLGKQVRINPDLIDRELELIKMYTGESRAVSCLAGAHYTQEYVFQNGCRAPPWQQTKGDICYVTIKPFDSAEFIIVANVAGFFSIPGGSSCADHDSADDSVTKHPTMIELIKTMSNHFATNIGKEEFSHGYQKRLLNEVERNADQGTRKTVLERLQEKADLRQRDPHSPTDIKPDKPVKLVSGAVSPTASVSPKRQSGATTKKTTLAPPTSEVPGTKSSRKKVRPRGDELPEDGLPPNTEGEVVSREPTPTPFFEPPGQHLYGEEAFEALHKRIMGGRNSRGSMVFSRTRPKPGHEVEFDADYASGDSSSDEEEEPEVGEKKDLSEMPADYWNMQKMLKVLKSGNKSATLISLCAMRDFSLTSDACQMAVVELGGVTVLLNLLASGDRECTMGSLMVLKQLASSRSMRQNIVDLKGLPLMVSLMGSDDRDIAALAAEAVSHIAQFTRARRIVRHYGGICKLVKLLDEKDEEMNRAGAVGLWSCSISTKNKSAILNAGAIQLLGRHLKLDHEQLLIPVIGILQECASQRRFRSLIRAEGMIPDIVRHLASPNQELQRLACNAIFRCAEDAEVRQLVRECEGIAPLATIVPHANTVELLTAVTGAIWICSRDMENAVLFRKNKAVDQLVSLLASQPEAVLVNIVGALSEFAKDGESRTIIRKAGGILPLVQMLTGTNAMLLINVTLAVARLGEDTECITVIDKLDGIRFLWSLLKSQNELVKANSLKALCPLLESVKEAAGMIRSFVGGLELVINLLKSDNIDVLSAVCKLITRVAADEENLAVMTDHGVVPLLANLAKSHFCYIKTIYDVPWDKKPVIIGKYAREQDELRFYLAEAIARCCNWNQNRVSFGEHNTVEPLVTFLDSKDKQVQQATCLALYHLSRDANNSIAMHKKNVVQRLLKLITLEDVLLQDYAAGCIRNIRLLAVANEQADMAKARARAARAQQKRQKPRHGIVNVTM